MAAKNQMPILDQSSLGSLTLQGQIQLGILGFHRPFSLDLEGPENYLKYPNANHL
jgi:hypothetical protein